VVGVAGDIKVHSLTETNFPYYYVPVRQFYATDTGLAVHLRIAAPAAGSSAAPDPLSLLPALRTVVHEVDPNVSVFEALTLEDYISAARFAQKTAASLLGVLSAIALALTSLGLYGVLAFAVSRRTAEIGVRLALGAQPGHIARLIMGQGAMLVGLGLALGLLLAAGASVGMARVFPGLTAFEPLLLAAAAALVTAAALLATWVPARRATKVDPLTALRAE